MPRARDLVPPVLIAASRMLYAPSWVVRRLKRMLRGRRSDLGFRKEAWLATWVTPQASRRLRDSKVIHLVLVGASLGEYAVMRRLADELRRLRPDVEVTYCMRERASVLAALQSDPGDAICYQPVDFLPIVSLWSRRFRPDALVFVERYDWPTLAGFHAARRVSCLVVNGVSRPPEAAPLIPRKTLMRWIHRPFRAMLVQSESDAESVREWVTPDCKVSITGNVKIDLRGADRPPEDREGLETWLRTSEAIPLIAAGSIEGADEERLVIDAFLQVRRELPCRLLLAPRNPGRLPQSLARLEEAGLSYSLRTAPKPSADVLLLDTLGELAYAYRSTVAAYVGGALTGNGHNVLEPAECGNPVAYGMRRGHFAAFQRLCEAAEVGERIDDAEALAAFYRRALSDAPYRAEVAHRAAAMLARERGALAHTAATLVRYLPSSHPAELR